MISNIASIFFEELKSRFSPIEGSYAKQIQKVLEAQSNYRLGQHTENSYGDIWTIIKPLSDKIADLETLKISIQDYLSKHGCQRLIDFLYNPLRLVLFYKNPKPILFSETEYLMTEDNFFFPFVLENKLCSINPNKEEFSHCLVSGITGSGKTVLLKDFICSLRGDSLVYFCNPKNDESFVEIEKFCSEYVVSQDSINEIIERTFQQTNDRLNYPSSRKIFLFVDELNLVSAESKKKLVQISEIGRSLNVHLILATQRPTKSVIPTELKSQMTYTLTGRVSSKTEAYFATGMKNSGADKLQGSGLFILNSSSYNNVLVQALLFDSTNKEEHKKVVEVYDYTFDNAPKIVLNRKEWMETIIDDVSVSTPLKEIQESHKNFYDKLLNSKTASKIKEWIIK